MNQPRSARPDTKGQTHTMSEFTLNDQEWETGSGLALADANVVVTAASFGYNANLGADVLCANFTFVPVEGGEPIEQSFSVGKGWEAVNKGANLVSEDGRPRKINGQTNYGRLIDSAVQAVQASGREMPFASPRMAEGWVGTSWHVGTVAITTTNPVTKKEAIKDAFVFTAFLGSVEGSAGNVGKADKASTTTTKKASGLDPKLRMELTELAEAADDHDSFVEKALALDGVEGNREAEKLVLKTGPGSIWHEVKEG